MMMRSFTVITCLFTYFVAAFHDTSVSYAQSSYDKSARFKVVYEAAGSMCYNEGRAAECMPPFTNVAEGVVMQATSTCGVKDKNEQFCTSRLDSFGRPSTHCELCNLPDKFHPKHLTDRQQMNNETLWVSGQVAPGETVNLTLSLGKTFEVHYISLRQYGRLPDAITLYKSSDFGKTWQPWQHFSTDCYRAFHLPTSNERNAQISAANIQEVLCVSLKESGSQDPMNNPSKVIAFSTVIGRSSSHPWSPALIDWMTMTDLRVSLTRFANIQESAQQDVSGLLLTPNMMSPAYIFRVGDADRLKTPSSTVRLTKHHIQSDAASNFDQKSTNYAFSDLAVGGRCKCNGHANRCVRERSFRPGTKLQSGIEEWGPLRCECQHNTAGTDCEHCALGYLDRPWARAVADSANECKPCNCANHTTDCVFNVKAYRQSGGRHGGVCLACRHNTEGPNCEQCSAGYTLNPYASMDSPYACRECHCHSIGSIPNQPCDRKTGQCPCKPGVVGLTCDRCQDGYKQTNLSDQPCIRATEHFAFRRRNAPAPPPPSMNHEPMAETVTKCPQCKPHKKRVRFKNFCRRDAVFVGTVVSHKMEKNKCRYEVRIQETWRVEGTAGRLLPKKASANLPPFPIWVGGQEIGVPNSRGQRSRCFCPELKLGETYLFLTDPFQVPHGNRMELMLNANSYVLPWREVWRRRLNKFVRRAAKGRCATTNTGETDREQNDSTRFRHTKRRSGPSYYHTIFQGNHRWTDADSHYTRYSSTEQRPSVQREVAANNRPMFHTVPDQLNIKPKQPQFYYNPYT